MAHSLEKESDSFVMLSDHLSLSNNDFLLVPPPNSICTTSSGTSEGLQNLQQDENLLSQKFNGMDLKSSLSTEYTLEDIESKLVDLLTENQNLRDTLQQNNIAMRQQVETLSKWQEEVFHVHQYHKIKFEETKDLIRKLRNENVELNKRLLSTNTNGELEKVNCENLVLKADLESTREKYYTLRSENSTLLDKVKSLESSQEQQSAESSANIVVTDDEYQKAQQRGFADRISQLTAQLLNHEETIDALRKELQTEKESIEILKIQVEVYQSDFNAEREAREKIAGEKESMAEDLRNHQRRNELLLEELGRVKRAN